jgi:hypothetical protein
MAAAPVVGEELEGVFAFQLKHPGDFFKDFG